MVVKRKVTPKARTKATVVAPRKKRIRAGRVIESLILAEQIRKEQDTGKHFFIGVYNGNVIRLLTLTNEDLLKQPIVLPLAFFVHLRASDDNHVRVLIKNPKGEVGYDIEAEVVPDPLNLYEPIVLTGGAMRISMPGDYEFVLENDGKRDKRIFRIMVKPESE